ncbi:hypothetical protein CRG98_003926, partial [Punica granatum]
MSPSNVKIGAGLGPVMGLVLFLGLFRRPSFRKYNPSFLFTSRLKLLLRSSLLVTGSQNMGETKDNDAYEEELLDYEEEEEKAPDSAAKVNGEGAKKGYVGIHSSGFRDFLLKPELLRAIVDSGFEHPSE